MGQYNTVSNGLVVSRFLLEPAIDHFQKNYTINSSLHFNIKWLHSEYDEKMRENYYYTCNYMTQLGDAYVLFLLSYFCSRWGINSGQIFLFLKTIFRKSNQEVDTFQHQFFFGIFVAHFL